MLSLNNSGKERLSYSDVEPVIDADEYHTRSYEHVLIDQLPSIPALIDSGAEVCCIREELLRPLHVLPHKFIKLSGLRGEPEMVGCVRLAIRPSIVEEDIINLAPKVRAWFAVVPNLNEQVIITPTVAKLLESMSLYNMIGCKSSHKLEENDLCSDGVPPSDVSSLVVVEKSPAVVVEPSASESTGGSLVPGEEVSQDEELDSQTDARFVMAEDHQVVDISEDNIKFAQEQHDCPTLKSFWSFGRDQR